MRAAGLSLLFYYAAWLRYFTGGRTIEIMYQPLFGVPLPLAVSPVVFLGVSAYLLSSWSLAPAVVWFWVFHIWISVIVLKIVVIKKKHSAPTYGLCEHKKEDTEKARLALYLLLLLCQHCGDCT
jgi:hypothetical protein